MFIEIFFKMLLFKGGVFIYAEHCTKIKHRLTAKRFQNCSKQICFVDYCDVFISCLDFHSVGTHSLQRIHWWASFQVKYSPKVLFRTILYLHIYPHIRAQFFTVLHNLSELETTLKKLNGHCPWNLISRKRCLILCIESAKRLKTLSYLTVLFEIKN